LTLIDLLEPFVPSIRMDEDVKHQILINDKEQSSRWPADQVT